MIKHLLAALTLIIFFSASLHARKNAIILTDKKIGWEKSKRSINHTPTVSHDGNTFYIHSEIPIEDTQITIKDIYDNIIYSATVTILSDENTIVIPSMNSGSYILELEYDENDYYGYFEVTQ